MKQVFNRVGLLLILFIISLTGCKKERFPPEPLLTVTPSAGTINTVFDLDASQTVDPDGLTQLLESRWDFEGDGTWDTEFDKGLITARQYKYTGQYNPVVEIRDAQGLVASARAALKVEPVQQFTDIRDGRVYPIVRFGKQWWMARNLDYGKIISPEQNQKNNGIVEKYLYPGDDPDSLFGGLYQWSEAMGYSPVEGSQGICPPGWRIPTDSDWENLMSLFKDPMDQFVFPE